MTLATDGHLGGDMQVHGKEATDQDFYGLLAGGNRKLSDYRTRGVVA